MHKTKHYEKGLGSSKMLGKCHSPLSAVTSGLRGICPYPGTYHQTEWRAVLRRQGAAVEADSDRASGWRASSKRNPST